VQRGVGVARVCAGERGEGGLSTSFDEFYAAHFSALVVQVHAGIGNLAEAQDVVQEAFCRAWGRWEQLTGYCRSG
jgi:RNA polymerase sigma-70 factor, ECF subfamily